MIILSDKAKETVKGSNKIKGALCEAFDKTMRRIEQWVDNDDPAITSATAVEIIMKKSGMSREDVLTRQEEEEKEVS